LRLRLPGDVLSLHIWAAARPCALFLPEEASKAQWDLLLSMDCPWAHGQADRSRSIALSF
jgi:hypothetical protein